MDRDTITLNAAVAVKTSVEDVDGDGDDDLVAHFRVQDLEFVSESTDSLFLAAGIDGGCVGGSDSVRIVPPKGKGKNR